MNKFVYDKETFSTVSCDFIQFDVGAILFCSAKNGMNLLTKLKTIWKENDCFYESHLLAIIADFTEIPFFDNLEKKLWEMWNCNPETIQIHSGVKLSSFT